MNLQRRWELTKADGSGVGQGIIQQSSNDVGLVMPRVESGVVVYAHKVQSPLDKGRLICCELGQSFCNPCSHRRRVISEEERIREPSVLNRVSTNPHIFHNNNFSSVAHHPSWNSCALLVASMSIVLFVIGSYQMTSNAIPIWPFWVAYNCWMQKIKLTS